jgi:hypothetical protein
VGFSGTIAKSTDAGVSWSVPASPTANNLNGVFFTSASTGHAVGDAGTIITTTVGGTTAVNTPADPPAALKISASNYPNPFTPSTTITFTMQTSAHVRVAVYNALGAETAVLADGDFATGTHALRLDASRIPAGIYMYRITSSGSTSFGRMLCIK